MTIAASKSLRAEELFIRADRCGDRGDYRTAFRLMLAAAKLGELGAQLNVGNYYDEGKGVRKNRTAALYWYKKACKRGYAAAASNIGVLYRTEGKYSRALYWFKRAIEMGDEEAHLEIGKHYMEHQHDLSRASEHLRKVLKAESVTEAGVEEAARLLKTIAENRGRKLSRQNRPGVPS